MGASKPSQLVAIDPELLPRLDAFEEVGPARRSTELHDTVDQRVDQIRTLQLARDVNPGNVRRAPCRSTVSHAPSLIRTAPTLAVHKVEKRLELHLTGIVHVIEEQEHLIESAAENLKIDPRVVAADPATDLARRITVPAPHRADDPADGRAAHPALGDDLHAGRFIPERAADHT